MVFHLFTLNLLQVIKRMKFTVEETKEEESSSFKIGGSALGPDWHRSLGLSGGAEVKCDQIFDK